MPWVSRKVRWPAASDGGLAAARPPARRRSSGFPAGRADRAPGGSEGGKLRKGADLSAHHKGWERREIGE